MADLSSINARDIGRAYLTFEPSSFWFKTWIEELNLFWGICLMLTEEMPTLFKRCKHMTKCRHRHKRFWGQGNNKYFKLRCCFWLQAEGPKPKPTPQPQISAITLGSNFSLFNPNSRQTTTRDNISTEKFGLVWFGLVWLGYVKIPLVSSFILKSDLEKPQDTVFLLINRCKSSRSQSASIPMLQFIHNMDTDSTYLVLLMK